MAKCKPRLFSNAGYLRTISLPNLIRLLEPWTDYLSTQKIALSAGEFPYEELAQCLMNISEKTPTDLLDALHVVSECSQPKHFEPLLDAAQEDGFEIEDVGSLTPADLAVQIWLEDREFLEDWHIRCFAFNQRSFTYFSATDDRRPMWTEPDNELENRIRSLMDESFERRGRGRGSRIKFYPRDEKVWIAVQHGKTMRREGTHLDNGGTQTKVYRPQKIDVLIYDRVLGEVAIHAETKGDQKLYCQVLSFLVYGRDGGFEKPAKFTLDPLIDLGPDALLCGDIEGIEKIALVKFRRVFGGPRGRKEDIADEDLMKSFGNGWQSELRKGRVPFASFRVWITGGAPRGELVTLRLPNDLVGGRDEDRPLIERWLIARGFMRPKPPEAEIEPGPVLDVA